MPRVSAIKKIVLSFFVFLLLTFSFVPYVRAQGTWYNQNFQEWWTKVYDEDSSSSSEIFGERYTAAQVEWIIYGLFAFVLNKTTGDPQTTACLMNSDIGDCVERLQNLFTKPKGATANNFNQSFFSFMSEDRPLSGITYFKQIGRNLRIIPEAKAQVGFGFGALDPVLPLWRASRNIAYALFVLVILGLAFMIMFRVKISPQVVIGVQSALPKVALALVLVTFSYAIAGFLVDLMYVVIGIVSLLISQSLSTLGWASSPSSTALFGLLTQGPFGFGIIGFMAVYIVFFLAAAVIGLMGINGLGGFLSGGFAMGGFLAVLLTIIVAVLLIFIAIRVIWMLLRAFVSVLLLVLVAPFQITLGVISSDIGFGAWLKSFMGNLVVFPVTGLFLSLSFIFLFMVIQETFSNFLPSNAAEFFGDFGLGVPITSPFISAARHQGWPPLLVFGVKNSVTIIYLGVSLVILFILPKVADIIKAMIERKPFSYGTAIVEAFGPAKAGLTGYGLYSAAQIAEGKTPKPFGKYAEVSNWRPETKEAVSSILRAIFGKR